jgi:hypothetical protein
MSHFTVDLSRHADNYVESFAEEIAMLEDPQYSPLIQRRGPILEATPLGQMLIRNLARIFDRHTPIETVRHAQAL